MIKKIFPRAMKVVQALVEILEILVVVQAEITIWPY